ncbi:MAG: His/Gly/Thr/Pro-type tRNA ligase C-terminal domain-containing protein, partial [Solirubrobacterales bacterium]
QEHRPAMIHRALFGSFERFIGIMLEHYAGELPLWLAPVQAIVLPVSDRFNDYGASVRDDLRREGARVDLDDRSESVGRKIRDAELRKIPYMLVVGDREEQDGGVSVRTHKGTGEHRAGDTGGKSVKEFGERIRRELYSPALKPRKSSERDA